MLGGLISRIRRAQAPSPAARGLTPGEVLDAKIAAGIAEHKRLRLDRPSRTEAKRFAAARPKLDQLRHDLAMQMVDL